MPRPEVEWFAKKMESQLSANDHKSGWKDCELTYLLQRMKQEMDEVEASLINQRNPSIVLYECADVANFAMMIAHNIVNRVRK